MFLIILPMISTETKWLIESVAVLAATVGELQTKWIDLFISIMKMPRFYVFKLYMSKSVKNCAQQVKNNTDVSNDNATPWILKYPHTWTRVTSKNSNSFIWFINLVNIYAVMILWIENKGNIKEYGFRHRLSNMDTEHDGIPVFVW